MNSVKNLKFFFFLPTSVSFWPTLAFISRVSEHEFWHVCVNALNKPRPSQMSTAHAVWFTCKDLCEHNMLKFHFTVTFV